MDRYTANGPEPLRCDYCGAEVSVLVRSVDGSLVCSQCKENERQFIIRCASLRVEEDK